MNINLDEMGKKLHAKLDSSIDRLKAAQTHLEDVYKETETAIQTKLNAAKKTVDTKKQEVTAARARMKECLEARKTETKDLIAGWKANRDLKKLEKRAERAEKFAGDCIEVALLTTTEAQVAILEAVTARKDADDAI